MDNEEYPLVKFIRLQNGDDIVAETMETEDENGVLYLLINPLKVIYVQSLHHNYISVSFTPWVFPKICDHQEFMVHADDVLLISNVSEKMNEHYWGNLDSLEQKVSEDTPEPEKDKPEMEEETALTDILKEMKIRRTYH